MTDHPSGKGSDEPVAPQAEPAPPAKDPSRREQRKLATRLRLLDTARRLFVEQGYDETSYDDIARDAGVARQTAFNHFRRKEDFVAAWVAQRRGELQAAMAPKGDAPTSRAASARLLVIMRVMSDIYERRRDEGRVFMSAWVRLGGPILDQPVAAEMFAEVIRDGQAAGEFMTGIDADSAGEVIRAIYFDTLWRWADPRRDPVENELFELLLARIQLVLTGLCVDAERAQLRRAVDLARSLEVARLPSQESP